MKRIISVEDNCGEAARFPILYLRDVSTGDMEPTLRALLGENAKGLSAQTVSRLKIEWKDEYESWSRCSLANKNYVYILADGVYFTPCGDESKVCMLVLIGSRAATGILLRMTMSASCYCAMLMKFQKCK